MTKRKRIYYKIFNLIDFKKKMYLEKLMLKLEKFITILIIIEYSIEIKI